MRWVAWLAISFSLLLSGCAAKEPKVDQLPPQTEVISVKVEPQAEPEEFLKIITSNKMLYYMVKDIVKNNHNVDYMIKSESDQWNFQFTQDSLYNVASKDIFIYFGGDFEPWAKGFVDKLEKGSLFVVDSSRGVKILPLSTTKIYNEAEFKDNPYYWMNLDYYKISLSNIKNAIQQKDPRRSDIYEQNFKEAITRIEELDRKLSEELKNYKDYTFITIGDELDYFLSYYDLSSLKFNSTDDYIKLKEELDKRESLEKTIFLYDIEEESINYKPLMDEYKIKMIGINKYSINKSAVDMLEDNYAVLKELAASLVSEKDSDIEIE